MASIDSGNVAATVRITMNNQSGIVISFFIMVITPFRHVDLNSALLPFIKKHDPTPVQYVYAAPTSFCLLAEFKPPALYYFSSETEVLE